MSTYLIDNDDAYIWSLTQNGKFSLRLAWELCTYKQGIQGFSRMLWHKEVPLNWSLMVWRIIKEKVAFDDVLQKRVFI